MSLSCEREVYRNRCGFKSRGPRQGLGNSASAHTVTRRDSRSALWKPQWLHTEQKMTLPSGNDALNLCKFSLRGVLPVFPKLTTRAVTFPGPLQHRYMPGHIRTWSKKGSLSYNCRHTKTKKMEDVHQNLLGRFGYFRRGRSKAKKRGRF